MIRVYPDYYNEFTCIATKCSHNCCIGWEIDIDRDSFDFYSSLTGDFGKKLKENIDTSNGPHFVLGEKERCPFLKYAENTQDFIISCLIEQRVDWVFAAKRRQN